MGNLLQPTKVERHVVTREGELDVTITLNLNITLNSNGEASVAVKGETVKPVEKQQKKKDTDLEIPDFETPTQLVDFGQ